jgi:hypothetical protein
VNFSALGGLLATSCLLISAVKPAAAVEIVGLSPDGLLVWTNGLRPGICTVQRAASLALPWQPERNLFCLSNLLSTQISRTATSGFFRIHSLAVSPTPGGFTNLVNSYGLLETIAGSGIGQTDGINYWQSWNEGYFATYAGLSRPHFAMADGAGNIYIADKNSHSILKVTPNGIITTIAGNHVGGFNGEGPAPATTLQLNFPNGEWIRKDGTVYVFDTDNGRVRRVDTNGVMVTLFMATADGSAVSVGRGLWVKDDESLAYFCAGTKVRKWTPAAGVKTLASGFVELGDLIVDSNGDVLACDRGGSTAYRINSAGVATAFAGNGSSTGGGDGFLALQTGLYGVRSVWPVPTGGYLLLTHEGCQLWYLDSSGTIRLLVNGASGRTHAGDGTFFYAPDARISEGRSITMDYDGNIIVCESDWGYVRRIRFLPMH